MSSVVAEGENVASFEHRFAEIAGEGARNAVADDDFLGRLVVADRFDAAAAAKRMAFHELDAVDLRREATFLPAPFASTGGVPLFLRAGPAFWLICSIYISEQPHGRAFWGADRRYAGCDRHRPRPSAG